MKVVLKGKKEKGLTSFAYNLVAGVGIVFALSTLSTPLAIALVVLLLTGSFL